jgi:lysophospholipase L1-like esterase
MGSFVEWFSRSYKGVIVGLIGFGAAMLVVLAIQHVNSSRPAAGAVPGPIPTFSSTVDSKVRAVFFGDSYTEGVGASTPSKRWTTIVAAEERWVEVNLGQGGTGYVNGGPTEGQADQYATRISKIKAAEPDIVVISGSQNDLLFPAPDVATAIKTTIKQIHASVPDAQMIVVGPTNPGEIKAATRSNDEATREAAEAVGAIYVSSIDPGNIYQSPADYWSDGQHPSDSGHKHIADRVLEALPSDIPTGEATTED